ncbi:hypothetical protein CSC73_12430 [Pseudoxanthomonas sacheonensis]|nr:hypothetical protein CSC73_12430 [Pseudoxanthomonas sacheonensis]
MASTYLRIFFRAAFLPACACWAVAAPTCATAAELFIPDDKLLADYYFNAMELPPGMELEKRLDADLNADGLTDIAFVARNDESRVLGVLFGFMEEMDMGHSPAGKTALAVDALGPASLSAPKGVLVVEELTGGTTAISSTYRYRYDAKSKRMRLIGDDVKLYSRTNAHGWQEISTNRLTGLQIRRSADLSDAGDYVEKPETRGKVPTTPLYIEDAPAPETTLGWDQ